MAAVHQAERIIRMSSKKTKKTEKVKTFPQTIYVYHDRYEGLTAEEYPDNIPDESDSPAEIAIYEFKTLATVETKTIVTPKK